MQHDASPKRLIRKWATMGVAAVIALGLSVGTVVAASPVAEANGSIIHKILDKVFDKDKHDKDNDKDKHDKDKDKHDKDKDKDKPKPKPVDPPAPPDTSASPLPDPEPVVCTPVTNDKDKKDNDKDKHDNDKDKHDNDKDKHDNDKKDNDKDKDKKDYDKNKVAECYPKYKGTSKTLVTVLKSIGVNDTGLFNRTKIAKANGILDYTGTVAQDTWLVGLAKAGTLARP
jgi:type IV secretory pathway VirB10-like protein